MYDSTLDLFCEKACAEAFMAFVEDAASELEITVDYYLEEFFVD
jgi:hypothetical protein